MLVLSALHPPTEGIRHSESATEAHVLNQNFGRGTVYIAESRLSWIGGDGRGFSLDYPSISLHAISRDVSSFPHECLFLMVDSLGEEGNNSEGSEGDEDSGRPCEIRLVPQDKGTLDVLYQSMCDCQALHPDPDDSVSDDDDFYGDEGDSENLTPAGQAQLERLENIFDQQDGMDNPNDEPQIGGRIHNGAGDPGAEEPMEEDQFADAE